MQVREKGQHPIPTGHHFINLFNHSPICDHSDCFQHFAISNSATVNNLVRIHFCICIYLLLFRIAFNEAMAVKYTT